MTSFTFFRLRNTLTNLTRTVVQCNDLFSNSNRHLYNFKDANPHIETLTIREFKARDLNHAWAQVLAY